MAQIFEMDNSSTADSGTTSTGSGCLDVLPNEILATVLERVPWTPAQHLDLALTTQRFREIINTESFCKNASEIQFSYVHNTQLAAPETPEQLYEIYQLHESQKALLETISEPETTDEVMDVLSLGVALFETMHKFPWQAQMQRLDKLYEGMRQERSLRPDADLSDDDKLELHRAGETMSAHLLVALSLEPEFPLWAALMRFAIFHLRRTRTRAFGAQSIHPTVAPGELQFHFRAFESIVLLNMFHWSLRDFLNSDLVTITTNVIRNAGAMVMERVHSVDKPDTAEEAANFLQGRSWRPLSTFRAPDNMLQKALEDVQAKFDGPNFDYATDGEDVFNGMLKLEVVLAEEAEENDEDVLNKQYWSLAYSTASRAAILRRFRDVVGFVVGGISQGTYSQGFRRAIESSIVIDAAKYPAPMQQG